ncbi:hypothetical protein ABZ847_29525 [Streptomyces bauhiniae]
MTGPMMLSDLKARVERGVAWLDEHLPDWWRADRPSQGFDQGGPIDLDALVMRDPCGCVLGQLLGNYYRAELSIDTASACGFDTAARVDDCDGPDEIRDAMRDEFEALAELWSQVISRRRAGS